MYTIHTFFLFFFELTVTDLVGFLSEKEALIELGLVEAAADQGDGTVIRSTVVLSPQLQQNCLSCHVFSVGLKTQSDIYCIDQVQKLKLNLLHHYDTFAVCSRIPETSC